MAAAEAWDIRDPAQRVPDPDGDVTNWTHLNSVSIGPRGNVVLSFRARNQVVSLSADLRAVEWQLHGPDSDFESRTRTTGSSGSTPHSSSTICWRYSCGYA